MTSHRRSDDTDFPSSNSGRNSCHRPQADLEIEEEDTRNAIIGEDESLKATRRPVGRPRKKGQLECGSCNRKFGRAEHLTRHARSHQKNKSLKCSACAKEFYRMDALKRHELIHKEPKRSLLSRGSRACISCAEARRKCTGDVPCAACSKRQIKCDYPSSGRINGLKDTRRRYTAASIDTSYLDQAIVQLAHYHEQDTTGQEVTGLLWNTSTSSTRNFDEVQFVPPETMGIQDSSLRSMSISGISDSPDTTSVVLDPDLAQSIWSPNNATSINWLPNDWVPNFQPEGDQHLPLFDDSEMHLLYLDSQTRSAAVQTARAVIHSSQRAARDEHAIPIMPSSTRDFTLEENLENTSPGFNGAFRVGHYYVNGEGARLPRIKKTPHDTIISPLPSSTLDIGGLESKLFFPTSLYGIHGPTRDTPDGQKISQVIYDKISLMFNQTCIATTLYTPFLTTLFPSIEVLNLFLDLYFEHFQPILPFIHQPTFAPTNTHWLLILAMSATGSQYIETEKVDRYAIPMHEFLWRAIQTMMFSIRNPYSENVEILPLTQAKLLNAIGLLYSGDSSLLGLGKQYHSDLASFCLTVWKTPGQEKLPNDNAEQISQNWRAWSETESLRRTGYCIWLLDCMWAFHFQTRPMLSLVDAIVTIPSPEVTFETTSALDWQQLYGCSPRGPSLQEAIQLVYVEKRLQSSTGEFSRILMIHALFRRTWEVENYFRQPLSFWDPTAEKENINSIGKSLPVWLPGISTYSKWRNSACDCLDVFHWFANSVIGAASGMEHPTVLHLHLARVILLTPFREILNLAHYIASRASSKSNNNESTTAPIISDEEAIATRNHIQLWATKDQYKARLAMIHAGVLLWHVRRFSTDAFYEPSSVFLGTLALWAYGTFAEYEPAIANASSTASAPSTSTPANDSEDSDQEATSIYPTSMQLDRPADDELVQLFVKRGLHMQAKITGVGNLCTTKGPERVLTEGKRLLTRLRCWRSTRVAISTLSDFARGVADINATATADPTSTNAGLVLGSRRKRI